ncbi:MAG: glucosamine 6-phosphate synthetase [Solibacillus sp.]
MRYKRTILWIIPLAVLGVMFYFFGPQKEVTDNQYISYVKDQPLIASAEGIDTALTSYCEKGKWVYFQTTKMQNVVEFKGDCPVDGKVAPVNLQIIVEKELDAHHVGALLINAEQQTDEQKAAFLSTIYAN